MDDEAADGGAQPMVNRDEPIPIVALSSPPEDDLASPKPGSKRDMLKESAEKLKEKLQESSPSRSQEKTTIQDRLFATLLQQVIPTQDFDQSDDTKDRRSRKYIPIERPNFSLPVMSTNFRRFNARIGVAFVFQNRLIRLFSWRVPSQTLSFLAVYTFICLDPYLLAVVPIVACLFFLMVPAFLARHPPPPASSTEHPTYSIHGPPVAPARTIKPAPELSKDFFRNMRDLQNSMEDFSRLHDSLIALITPYTNFSNEALSSTLFLALTLSASLLFLASAYLPWRFIFLTLGWALTLSGHPSIPSLLLVAPHIHPNLQSRSRVSLSNWIDTDIALDDSPEKREVEIFELQRRDPLLPLSASEWEPWLFTPGPFDPLTPTRIAGERPKGTQFFEEVRPPTGWRWADKKWTLDLLSREWVDERIITGVEVEMEGERWVYDVDGGEKSPEGKGKKERAKVGRTWDEGTGVEGIGEWRRRRWTRMVQREIRTGEGS
ncbi:MAG: hypothetical protein M1820_008880 [Bogoriella megaspora]|nr:MAG: hypothetical protein M1820_008880 [Bogoriella megaspora]